MASAPAVPPGSRVQRTGNTELVQIIGKPGDLGGFAGAVAALEGYQPARHAAESKPKNHGAHPFEDAAEEADPFDTHSGIKRMRDRLDTRSLQMQGCKFLTLRNRGDYRPLPPDEGLEGRRAPGV